MKPGGGGGSVGILPAPPPPPVGPGVMRPSLQPQLSQLKPHTIRYPFAIVTTQGILMVEGGGEGRDRDSKRPWYPGSCLAEPMGFAFQEKTEPEGSLQHQTVQGRLRESVRHTGSAMEQAGREGQVRSGIGWCKRARRSLIGPGKQLRSKSGVCEQCVVSAPSCSLG